MKIRFWVTLLFMVVVCTDHAWATKIYKNGDLSLEMGFWGQAWYQYVEDAKDRDGDGKQETALYDTMIRRAYFYAKASATPWLDFFLHVAGDRLDQDELHDRPSLGLGANLILRDGWVTVRLLDESAMLQLGRMYVPITRNYGTTSTKSLLATDLDWSQGGIRGGIFYPSKVGRDDGVCLWGNVLGKRLQYRFMVAKGIDKDTMNPDDNPRYAGRLSWSFFEPETSWFNKGTYLGKKRVLALGMGFDMQNDLVYDGSRHDYSAWTVDVHWDYPLDPSGGAITMEAAYINVNSGPNSLNYTNLKQGDDADIVSVKSGYILPGKVGVGRVQPFIHYERIGVDNKDSTNIYGLGVNYFLKGQANKLSVDLTYVDQEEEKSSPFPVQDHLILTFQVAAGF